MAPYEPLTYYDKFLQYFNTHYYVTGGEKDYCRLVYQPNLKKWYEYTESGFFELRTSVDIDEIYLRAMRAWEHATSTQQKNHCITYLKVQCQYKGEWLDNSTIYDCVLNGIVNLETRELHPHGPQWKFKYQIQRNYDPEVNPVIPSKFNKCLEAIPDEYDRENYIKFWLAVVHKKHVFEIFLMCYGVKWGGKSSNLNIFAEMYGSQVVSKKPLHFIGRRFGLSNIYDKRINIHPDMPIVDLDPFTISQLKSITGNDGDMEVEIKGLTPIEYRIMLFLAFGINQLMGFKPDAAKEYDSIMRRVVLVEFPNVQELDAEFKASLLDPRFLDKLYSWFVVTNPIPLFEEANQEEWVQHNKKKWLENSDPVLRILLDNYEYKEGSMMKVHDVIQLVRTELQSDGLLEPNNMKNQITNAFSTMNIFHNGKRGKLALYENCRQIDPEDVALAEILEEVEKEELSI